MFRKYLAALLLLPASLAIHRSPRAWLKAWGAGSYPFFSGVVKRGPLRVRRSDPPARRLLVYYPMKAGIEILRNGVGTTLRKIWLTLRGRPARIGIPETPGASRAPDLAFIPPERIREMIRDPAIRIVSFDVFDTLLVRPALRPKDIFHLIARKVDRIFGVDFIALRWDAEARCGKANACLRDIYADMARRHGLDPATARALLEEEIRCEATLLSPRPDVKELYDEAARLGKRIIAVSDMYLPGDTIADILAKKGCPVSAVYVSCEYGARKDDGGGLYAAVLEREKARPAHILHVGDNWRSDCLEAIRKKITAVWLPSAAARCFPHEEAREALFGEAVRRDPLWSLFWGFSLNRLYGDWATAPRRLTNLRDLNHFAQLVPAPLLTAFCLFLATDKDIRGSRKTIYFASRDGWLPHLLYARIRERLGGPTGVYFAAGRRAYYPFLYKTFFDFAASLPGAGDPGAYTLGDFTRTYFADSPVFRVLETGLSEEEKGLLFFPERKRCLEILRRFEGDIAAFLRGKRARARAYYESVFDPAQERLLVFDLGYSGSVGKALTEAVGKPVDKVYFWAEPENGIRDRELGSTTRLFMKDPAYVPYHLILEELFSPCEGGVVDFDADKRPVTEPLEAGPAHRRDLAAAQAACLDYGVAFCDTLGEYAAYATLREPDAATDLCRKLLCDAPFCNLRLFRNIAFPDPVYRSRAVSLEKKLEAQMPRRTVFSGTGFENPDSVFSRPPRPRGHPGIGIHLHLHHVPTAHEIVRYLQCFPLPFDLHVTITDATFAPTVRNLFSRAFLPRVRTLRVLPVPNRGRDVAPWVLGMRPFQGNYDLFCHIHGKESAHIGFGDAWRKYLFDNLIRCDTAARIIDIFTDHPDMGCLFPAIHPGVRQVMTKVATPLYGSEREYGFICDMLDRMGLGGELRLSELFFSVGTMLWYRPPALRQLFACALRLEEFAPEPIGVGGTLAHAMERLPAIVAARNGYAVKSLTRHAAPS